MKNVCPRRGASRSNRSLFVKSRRGGGGIEGSPSLRKTPTRNMPFFASTIPEIDRKSTRLNSSHQIIPDAVFCFKKRGFNPPHTVRAHREGGLRHAAVGDRHP